MADAALGLLMMEVGRRLDLSWLVRNPELLRSTLSDIVLSFGDAPLEPELGDGPTSTLEQRHDIIRSLVMAALALGNAYAAIADER